MFKYKNMYSLTEFNKDIIYLNFICQCLKSHSLKNGNIWHKLIKLVCFALIAGAPNSQLLFFLLVALIIYLLEFDDVKNKGLYLEIYNIKLLEKLVSKIIIPLIFSTNEIKKLLRYLFL